MEDGRLGPLRNHIGGLTALSLSSEATRSLEHALASVWDLLDRGEANGMEPAKLHGRIESAEWRPPVLTFLHERHGGLIRGSSRAEVFRWNVNVEEGTATAVFDHYRQLRVQQARLDVASLAADTADRICAREQYDALAWQSDGSVRVIVGDLIPNAGPKQTVQGRRKRFWSALDGLMADAGWERELRGQNRYYLEPDA